MTRSASESDLCTLSSLLYASHVRMRTWCVYGLVDEHKWMPNTSTCTRAAARKTHARAAC
uniref:p0044F08.2 protein n=1 Tax=Oryza sativa subsp. japonica TaxID=39947 RepID=Q9AWV8_ORYSJ|nr:P0044F08.2 [Oryza sativa Japonica Group]